MDSDPLPMLEKSDALQRHEVHGNTQETGFDFRHLPSGAKRIKSMDGKAQKTTIVVSLRERERKRPKSRAGLPARRKNRLPGQQAAKRCGFAGLPRTRRGSERQNVALYGSQ